MGLAHYREDNLSVGAEFALDEVLGDGFDMDELNDVLAAARRRGLSNPLMPVPPARYNELHRERVPTSAAAVQQRLSEEVARIRLATGCGALAATLRLRATEEGRSLMRALKESIKAVDG